MVDVIVGTGAVGLFFAFELQSSGCDVIGVNPRIPVMPTTIVCKDQENPITLNVSTHMSDAVRGSDNTIKRVFVCVPPQGIPAVVCALNSTLSDPCDIIFCNNGIILPNIYEVLEQHRIWRALIFAGFTRCFSKIIYNGGEKILFGPINPLAERSPVDPICGFQILKWKKVQNIKKTEISKLFVNFVLARTIGDLMLQNSCFRSRHNPEETQKIAHCFSKCSRLVSEEELLDMLDHTITDTAANINSITLALQRGDAEPWKTLCLQIEGFARSGERTYLNSWLEDLAFQARKGWA